MTNGNNTKRLASFPTRNQFPLSIAWRRRATPKRHSFAAECRRRAITKVSFVMGSSISPWTTDRSTLATHIALGKTYLSPKISCSATWSHDLATVTVECQEAVLPKFDRCQDTERDEGGREGSLSVRPTDRPTESRSELPRSRTARTRHSHATAARRPPRPPAGTPEKSV